MNDTMRATAQACLHGAETDSLKFPDIIGRLMAAGFEGYEVDLRLGQAIYFAGDGGHVALPTHAPSTPVALAFDAEALKAAIREAQQNVPGYTYLGFCKKAAAAGCASYVVSFPGRRGLYIGRTGETHTEHFPQ